VLQHACSLAKELHRAYACARAAEQVLGKDDPRCLFRLVARERGDKGRNVDIGRAGLDTGGDGIYRAALQTAIGLDKGLRGGKRRRQLVEDRARMLGNHRHDFEFRAGDGGAHPRAEAGPDDGYRRSIV